MEFTLSVVLFCVGLYAVIAKRNLIKTIIGVAVMGYSINLMLILAGYRVHSGIPILSNESLQMPGVDPLAQAMVLVSVVLGLSITLLLTALSIKLYERYGTFDLTEIKKLKG